MKWVKDLQQSLAKLGWRGLNVMALDGLTIGKSLVTYGSNYSHMMCIRNSLISTCTASLQLPHQYNWMVKEIFCIFIGNILPSFSFSRLLCGSISSPVTSHGEAHNVRLLYGDISGHMW